MIKLLDTHTINKIAAGEVVERPASVIKELVENSVDAKSSNITVEIKNGGVDLIRITDNGKGIKKDEVEMAFLRHATSKISSAEDLQSVLSLGFRGEALASIAAVSHVELMTKTPGELTGKRVEVHGGKLQTSEEIACPEGTTIIMRQLFYNVPARKAFLKSMGTEAGKISDYMYKLALAHPEISFKYIQNNKLIFTTPGNGDLKQCVFQLYGKDIAKSIIPIYYEKEELVISGVVGKPTLTRANRQYEHFFINGRYIKSNLLQQAVEEAYKTLIMIGKFPFVVLHLQMLPEQVDVNVHPTKLEVRFKDPEILESIVMEGVRKHLRQENLIPDAESMQVKPTLKPLESEIPIEQVRVESFFNKYTPPVPYKPAVIDGLSTGESREEVVRQRTIEQENTSLTNNVYNEHKNVEEKERPFSVAGDLNGDKVDRVYKEEKVFVDTSGLIEEVVIDYSEVMEPEDSVLEDKIPVDSVSEDQMVYRLKEGIDYRIVGQLLQTYWLVEIEDKILVIDQHAAHERIMYESYMRDFLKSKVATQMLLIPETIRLSPIDFSKLQENKDFFEQIGFSIELFGQDQIIVREVPYLFNKPVPVAVLQDLLDQIIVDKTTNLYELHEERIIQMSCKRAVKARDTLEDIECKRLIEDLLNLENPYTCPHGRPTIVTLKHTDIEKIFKRIQ